MSETLENIRAFVAYGRTLSGYEKGEAQVFCDRLFKAFGHDGYKEAGATLEDRVKAKGRSTQFIDLLWRPSLLLEMKSRGEQLQKHYQQAWDYWITATPDRPQYVVLCNFDEFWIYDFNFQLHEPVDRVALEDLPDRYTALNFLSPDKRKPVFENDRVAVTKAAADNVAQVFNALIGRGEQRECAQRFILQCVVAMFSEDFDLLPKGLFSGLLDDCTREHSSYDLLGGLFRQMNSETPARGGRYQNVAYFNGGLFETIEPIELVNDELQLLMSASAENWGKVAPPVFGTLFQSSMDAGRRHAYGAHFTSEADIQRVVGPTIVRPWRERIAAASTLRELRGLSDALLKFQVLDPACGSGNFLYVAYRELVNLEMEILSRVHTEFGERARENVGMTSLVSTKQFHGIDLDPFGVELAKVTLMLAKRVALAETQNNWFADRNALPLEFEKPLPLDNLDANIRCDDALFAEWPDADAIIGNPPYQSKNKMQQELGRAYLNRVRDRYPDVPGHADYCVYWFRRAHDELGAGGRAGLVGTNTIRQNYSREGGLDYIVGHGGTITEAVSSQVWSGDAVVHVSIVNWLRGNEPGAKKLIRQLGDNLDSPWEVEEVDRIGAALSGRFDVTAAESIRTNRESDSCDQGQTHGHKGFLLSRDDAEKLLEANAKNHEVLKPYLTADEFLSSVPPTPRRYVIDFQRRSLLEARSFSEAFERAEKLVLPKRIEEAAKEDERNKKAIEEDPNARVNHHHRNFLNRWWLLSYPRPTLMAKIRRLPRYIACGQVTKRPIFVFVSREINPNAALEVFTFADDYSFGILQSDMHWRWFVERCSTLKGDFRYTSTTVYDSFAWPQAPTMAQVREVATAAVELRSLRAQLMQDHNLTLRELYRSLELPGESPLKRVHDRLNAAVRKAYGMSAKANALEFLFDLNQELAKKEASLQQVVGPGLPPIVKEPAEFITDNCIGVPVAEVSLR
jgi:type II restriction/modification system DNA methylase subunit YeeA